MALETQHRGMARGTLTCVGSTKAYKTRAAMQSLDALALSFRLDRLQAEVAAVHQLLAEQHGPLVEMAKRGAQLAQIIHRGGRICLKS